MFCPAPLGVETELDILTGREGVGVEENDDDNDDDNGNGNKDED